MRRTQILVIALTATAFLSRTSGADLSGPVVGFVQKASKIRPVIGIPGSAYLGLPMEISEMRVLAICSELRYAIGVNSDETEIRIVQWNGDTPRDIQILSAGSPIRSVALSPTGSAAVIITSGDTVDVVTGLPHKPVLRTANTPSGITAVAVSDDGNVLAVVEPLGVLSIITTQGIRTIAAADVRHMAFRPHSHDILYIHGSADQIVTISQSSSNPVVATVAGRADGILDARAIVSTQNGRYVVVANAGTKDILILDPSLGVVRKLPVPCTPSGLQRMSDSVLQLTCETSDLMRIVHLSHLNSRVLFIPEPVE